MPGWYFEIEHDCFLNILPKSPFLHPYIIRNTEGIVKKQQIYFTSISIARHVPAEAKALNIRMSITRQRIYKHAL
jgi:hypothetical protein